MQIHNQLPLFIECLKRWPKMPSASEFERHYSHPMREVAGDFFEDFHSYLEDLNWQLYRDEALGLNPGQEERRVRERIQQIEELFGFELSGQVVLMGAFTLMDGFARYDEGSHTVFLGVDESHGRGKYLDVLITHELTHVARETRPSVWEGWGLPARMTRSLYLESMTAVEHLFSEGLSCLVSEILIPGEDPGRYAYQTPDSLALVLQHGPALDRMVRRQLQKPDGGNYGTFYNGAQHNPPLPDYAHYVWAWQWLKALYQNFASQDITRLVGACSKEFISDALSFELRQLR